MVAYAKHYASRHIAERVREYRCQGKQIDLLKRNGIGPAEKCSLFARKCKNSFLLKRHIKQVHKREHLRRINTQISFESDFQRAGVSVDTVQCKPQAIGFKLKKHLLGSMSKGITCICLVSDDLGFSSLLADAQTLKIFVIVFGVSGCLKKYADYWFPWDEISQGLPAEDVQKAIHAWLCYHSIVHSTELNELGVSKVGANAEVECKDFSKSAVQRGAEPSTVVYEEPLASSDEDEPLSDDEKEWIYDDEIDELDDSWVDID
ncbi:hypothetical protein KP509_12G074500 [Ceratopteris richardii]|nr:hypothetical protein KP509_12G074500 [Ceratopteris richardii]